jgi:hypothetical protein
MNQICDQNLQNHGQLAEYGLQIWFVWGVSYKITYPHLKLRNFI